MTADRYKRRTIDRVVPTVESRVKGVEFSNPYPTFRAAISDADLPGTGLLDATMRRDYTTGTTDTVFWNYWDDDYNSAIFDPFFQMELGQETVSAVELLVPGLYGIRATIDWCITDYDPPTVPFNTWIGSNYDDGGMDDIYWDPTSNIVGTLTMDHFRVVWDGYTGAETSVEITVYHDNSTDEPLFIPGGFSGYWAMPPMLTIVYLGALEGNPCFYCDQ